MIIAVAVLNANLGAEIMAKPYPSSYIPILLPSPYPTTLTAYPYTLTPTQVPT